MKFIALYWGQIVGWVNEHNKESYQGHVEVFNMGSIEFLVLKPVTSINEYDLKVLIQSEYNREILSLSINKVERWNDEFFIDFSIRFAKNSGAESYLKISSFTDKYRDQLRGLGYITPFGDLSINKLLEYGWFRYKKVEVPND
ncbi:hypothetical protein [Sphingobacterium multivorum]|uniref:hypothetical protein n=1 Tax=Sphingobacterium multivorum TaxID=28454 RepID=UPI0036D04505